MIDERTAYIMKLADQDSVKIGDKQFRFRKITTKEFDDLEQTKFTVTDTKDSKEATKIINQIMRASAKCYFGIDGEYDSLPREDLGYAIEAGAYRAMYGRPFLSVKSTTGAGSEAKSESVAEPQASSPNTPDSKDSV